MKQTAILLAFVLLLSAPVHAVEAADLGVPELHADAAVLMEQKTGEILYEKNAHERLSPASVTKIMTILLIAEQIEAGEMALTDPVTTSENAASMGGSQVYLEPGESMTVDEMLKCIVVASANDCAVAMAEHVSGTETAFTERMNQRAAELNMQDTHFVNCTGLTDSDEHYTSAYDIAVMTREVLRYDWLRNYTTLWTDSIRGGEFGLTNTNKLVRSYPGTIGMKTGFTQKAMYCLSAAAERDGDCFIAVILHAPGSAERFADAQTLLNSAFANYTVFSPAAVTVLPPVKITLGTEQSIQPAFPEPSELVTQKGTELSCRCELPDVLPAPVSKGDVIGKLQILSGEEVIRELPITAPETVSKLSLTELWTKMLGAL